MEDNQCSEEMLKSVDAEINFRVENLHNWCHGLDNEESVDNNTGPIKIQTVSFKDANKSLSSNEILLLKRMGDSALIQLYP